MSSNSKIRHSLIGDIYNSLTIMTEPFSVVKNGKSRRYVKCRCNCEKEVNVILNCVMSGHTSSCGCASLIYKDRNKAKKMRSSFNAMHRRCKDEKGTHYKYYKEKGIEVCKEWSNFGAFYNDMQSSWQPGLELDREKGDKGYYKLNCRWVSSAVNQRNKSNIKLNEEDVLSIRQSSAKQRDLALIYGVTQNTISRIKNNKRWQL